MRAFRFCTLLITLCLWALGSTATAQSPRGEYISQADITVRIDKAGNLEIREEIDYVKPRGVIKRGIFRELPTKVREGKVTYNKAYNLSLATRNGQPETVTQQSKDGAIVWRLGRADCLLYTSPSPRDRTRSRMPSSA